MATTAMIVFLGAACGSPYIVFILRSLYGFMLEARASLLWRVVDSVSAKAL